MEPTTGLEPVNLFLTKEVLYLLSYVGILYLLSILAHVVLDNGSLTRLPPSPTCFVYFLFLVERGGFEPPKAYAGRFTVCSLWPLGNLST